MEIPNIIGRIQVREINYGQGKKKVDSEACGGASEMVKSTDETERGAAKKLLEALSAREGQ